MRETHLPFGGVVRDVSQARTVAEVIDLVPSLGNEIGSVPVYAKADNGEFVQLKRYKAPAMHGYPVAGEEGVSIGHNFGLVQYRANLEVAQHFVDLGGEYRSVGTTHRGLKTLVEVRLPQAFFTLTRSDGRVDEFDPRVWIIDANDGTHSRWVGLTFTQLFCMNQLPGLFADRQVRRYKHTRLVMERQGDAKQFLTAAIEQSQEEQQTLRALEARVLSPKEFGTFVSQLLLDEDDSDKALAKVVELQEKKGRALAIFERKYETLANLYQHGTGNCGRTAFDALSAVTEWRTKGGSANEDAELLARLGERRLAERAGVEVREAIADSNIVLTESERRREERRLHSNLTGTSADMVRRAAKLLLAA